MTSKSYEPQDNLPPLRGASVSLPGGRWYPAAACTLEGRHLAPPLTVGIPSAFSLVCDRLEGHARRAHSRDPLAELRMVRDARRPLATCRAHTVPSPLHQSLSLPARHLDDRAERQTPGFFFGVETSPGNHKTGLAMCQPLQHPSELRYRMSDPTQFGNHDSACLASRYSFQRIPEPGPLERSTVLPLTLTNDR